MTKLSEALLELGVDVRETEPTPRVNELRIVEHRDVGLLEGLDDDCSVMDVPLNLDEGCSFDFGKHMDAILEQQSLADEEHAKLYRTIDSSIENRVERDRRYLERASNRTRVR